MRQLTIGNVTLENSYILAPMAGVTDLPFRLLCKEQGAGLLCMEMVSAKAVQYENRNTYALLKIHPDEMPVSLQLFGSEPDTISEVAKRLEELPFSILDINMGCPVPKVVNNGEGSALMKNPQLAYEILARMTDAVSVPVTVKFRAGWDSEHINAEEIAVLAEKAGVAAVAVHGRTREQFYNGRADWQVIARVKAAVKIPVIGNGDILTVADGQRMLAETGCDGLMLGRGADGNPWLFSRLQAALSGLPVPQEPPLKEKLALALRHLEMLIEYKNESVAVKEMRRHIGAYLKGMPKAAEYRGRFHQTETYADFKKLLAEYIEAAEKFGA